MMADTRRRRSRPAGAANVRAVVGVGHRRLLVRQSCRSLIDDLVEQVAVGAARSWVRVLQHRWLSGGAGVGSRGVGG